MVDAHVDSVLILGEAFREDCAFSFSEQDTVRRVQELVPVMVHNRMCPPPEEIYSLHRKMSGVFLLCAKLKGDVKIHPLFFQLYNDYRFGGSFNN